MYFEEVWPNDLLTGHCVPHTNFETMQQLWRFCNKFKLSCVQTKRQSETKVMFIGRLKSECAVFQAEMRATNINFRLGCTAATRI